jgi:hypothetical protein
MRALFLGYLIDVLTMTDTVRTRTQGRCVANGVCKMLRLNVAKFVNMRFDPVLTADVAGSDVISVHSSR